VDARRQQNRSLPGLPKEPHTEINVVFSVIHSFLVLTSEPHHPFSDHMKVQTESRCVILQFYQDSATQELPWEV
jgi:hypothetical protein